MLHDNPDFLEKLRAESIRTANELTWTAAGEKLLETYRTILSEHQTRQTRPLVLTP
jgi:hypothetical protein